MGVFDQELILPGTITEIVSDYSYGYDTSLFGTTDSVTIIGTAFNGPVGKPVEIYSPEHARYIFGETYDYTTRKEATLAAEIQDAWDRGCRTIYAIRVSGKDIFKDFAMVPETSLKLRVSGIFPSNGNKDIYMVYDDTTAVSTVKIYKPADRATIQEKLEGLVESDESILVATLEISASYSLTKDSRLVEFIKLVNEHTSNNVLRLSIVGENGNDVTIASKEAQGLTLGAMFPGAYFIGRDTNVATAATDLQYKFVGIDGAEKPYATFEGTVFKKLVLNSDVTADLPIFGEVSALNVKFAGKVIMATLFDFAAVPGKADLIFGKDTIDYEEVEISDFDLYMKLGSGFAITATAEANGATVKVKETPVSDVANRIKPLNDGIYSMIENLKSDYRILANGTVDSVIAGKIPKRDAFKIATGKDLSIFNGFVKATAKTDAKDMTEVKKYKFSIVETVSEVVPTTIAADLYTSKVVKRSTLVADTAYFTGKTFPEGTLFFVGVDVEAAKLYRITDGVATELVAASNAELAGKLFLVGTSVYSTAVAGTITFTEVEGLNPGTMGTKGHILVESGKAIAVYTVTYAVGAAVAKPLGSLEEIFGGAEDQTLIAVQSEYGTTNEIAVKSTVFDYTTLEELVALMNEDAILGKYFTFAVATAKEAQKDEYVGEISAMLVADATVFDDKTIGYDTSLYIPYKTTDNFARHLAQHCTYTSLKTAPTHGVIGCGKLMDVNLNSVASKIDATIAIDMNLYAKKSNGRDMLDRNNLPYPIGKNISVVFGQYPVTMDNGYSYISNGASGYAGMASKLVLEQSSTGQAINISTPMYELTNFQLGKLTQKGFVTFKQSYTKGFVVTDGITMAPATSTFRRLNVTRIVNAIEEVIRAATEPFIGKQNHLANRNSMQTAIKSSLEKLKGQLIEDFDFKLIVDSAAAKLGIINIDYAIVPIYEIREVRNRISIKESI